MRYCTWCGGETGSDGSDYCSDFCVQADMEGIDEAHPITVLAHTDDAYLARKWGGSF
ncbi:hypothetical protein [Streptomyces griseus]|uniref:hypothetical protein n=1 Tax=Streptomyces griseus TaxID=1911 RepID=UPI0033DDBD9D